MDEQAMHAVLQEQEESARSILAAQGWVPDCNVSCASGMEHGVLTASEPGIKARHCDLEPGVATHPRMRTSRPFKAAMWMSPAFVKALLVASAAAGKQVYSVATLIMLRLGHVQTAAAELSTGPQTKVLMSDTLIEISGPMAAMLPKACFMPHHKMMTSEPY